MFVGIVNCGRSHHPAPNGYIFRLEQTVANKCMWRLEGSIWKPEFKADLIAPANSQLRLSDHDGWSFFTDQQVACPDELQPFVNDQLNCIPMYGGSEGFGTIWWNAALMDVAVEFGLNPGTDLRYELRDTNGDFEIHKFCDRFQRTNVRFKI